MISDVVAMVEENVDRETMGVCRLFSEWVKDKVRNTGNETARNRTHRGNVITSRYTETNQGSQKVRAKKIYTFPCMLEAYK